ncbi:MAG: hypothetical protein HWD60_03885 [Defluviicoccus sp.]|nr:MAG: hypothetical protein HWD60_03885 [Defluviicoccus sp.]
MFVAHLRALSAESAALRGANRRFSATLGFVVYPTHRRVKVRKVRSAHGRLRARFAAYHAGEISFAELDAAIQGWIAHVAHADRWGCAGTSSTRW